MPHRPPMADDLVAPLLELLQTLRTVCDGDLEKNVILLAIAERAVRHPAVRGTGEARRLAGELSAFPGTGVNAHSIAESTGIPRETVRRKVAELIAAGWIGQEGRSLRFTPEGYRALTPARRALEQAAVQFSEVVRRKRPDTW